MTNAISNSPITADQALRSLITPKRSDAEGDAQAPRPEVSFPPVDAVSAFRAVEDVFDLGAKTRSLDLAITNLNEPEIAEYLSLTAKLLQAGVVGFEDLDVNGRPVQSFVPFEIAGGYTEDARPYRGPAPTGNRLNLVA